MTSKLSVFLLISIATICGIFYMTCQSSIAVQPAIVRGTVYDDENGNGVKDLGEPVVSLVNVQLIYLNGTIADIQKSNAAGLYNFNETAGEYTVREFSPVYTIPTEPVGGNYSVINITAGSNNTFDFGNKPTGFAIIQGTVYNDQNGNGVKDSGEPKVAGVRVDLVSFPGGLFGGLNRTVTSMTTNSTGEYIFTGVSEGLYEIRGTVPTGMSNTQPGNPFGNYVPAIVNSSTNTFDFGNHLISNSTTVSGIVYNDKNGNGVRDNGESGTEGVKVILYSNATQLTIGNSTTDPNGRYTFSNVPVGGITIFETLPSEAMNTQPGGLSPGEYKSSVSSSQIVAFDFGNFFPFKPTNLIGIIYNDANGNGIRDNGDSGIGGIRIIAVDLASKGTILNTTTTANGTYSFNNVTGDDTFLLQVTPVPVGFIPSNGTHSFVYKIPSPGQNTINFSLLPINASNSAKINGTIFNDTNKNGVQDLGEKGLNNTQVFVVDFLTLTQKTVHSDVNGHYDITGVLPDIVLVQIAPVPAGFLPLAGHHSFAYPPTLALGSTTTLNFPLKPVKSSELMTINATVFNDTNNDGIRQANETGLAGVQIFSFVLLTAEQQNKFTNTNGTVIFHGVTPDVTLVQVISPVNYTATSPTITLTSGLGFKYFNFPQAGPGATLKQSFGLH